VQPLEIIFPSLKDITGVPQLSVAEAVPSAALICAAVGLQPAFNVVPEAVISGAIVSTTQVMVRDVPDTLPQASVAVKVLVCVRLHPLEMIFPSLNDTTGVPQLSVADAVPSAALICAAVGLQPAFNVVPEAVIIGAVVSATQVMVREVLDTLPQASVAVKVLVCVRLQPLRMTFPSLIDITGVPQLSVAEAVPSAALICATVGLQPAFNVVPEAVISGAVVSTTQVIVREVPEKLPQASVAVKVLVCVRLQPLEIRFPSKNETTGGVPQLSVAEAVPSAALICAADGLQPAFNVVPEAVIIGAIVSITQLMVRDVPETLPHASAAVKVLVCVRLQPLEMTFPSLYETTGVPQLSVAEAVPSAALI
jgi:hypothetical protein